MNEGFTADVEFIERTRKGRIKIYANFRRQTKGKFFENYMKTNRKFFLTFTTEGAVSRNYLVRAPVIADGDSVKVVEAITKERTPPLIPKEEA